jgi:dihydrofolate reductase
MDAASIGPGEVVYFLAQSIDGFIADEHGDDSWLADFFIPELGFHDFIARVGVVIMGRRTWDKIENRGKWPYGQIPGVVASHRQVAAISAPVTVVAGSAQSILAEARTKSPPDAAIWLVGGADLATQFLEEGVLSRIELFTFPLLLGAGTPAFRNRTPVALDLVASGTYPRGITRNTWRPLSA